MRSITCVSITLILSAGALFSAPSPKDDPSDPSLAHYAKHAVGPKAVVMAGVGAGVNQLNDTPREWGQGGVGFGRRFASAFGKHIVHKAIQYPVSKLLHEEFGYHRSVKQGFGPRLKDALLATVITHKTTTEKPTVAVGEISGAMGSGLISRLWQPASVRAVGHGFASGGITLAIDAGLNVFREFWPNIRHPHNHGQTDEHSQTDERNLKGVAGEEDGTEAFAESSVPSEMP